MRSGLPVPEFPAIIGDEASGVVKAVGPNVTLVKVGDTRVPRHRWASIIQLIHVKNSSSRYRNPSC
jgi:NADPH:quinone reductase-like Zn-dependent oxidoreductase